MEEISRDERFSSVFKDPRFMKVPSQERKTKIDKRFHAMFTDKNYQLNYVMDKRGRPMNHTSSEDLKKFYNLASSESEDGDDDYGSSDDNVSSLSNSNDKGEQKDEVKKAKNFKAADSMVDQNEFHNARNSDESICEDGTSDSDSNMEEECSVSSDEEDDNEIDHKWEELDANAPAATEITKRLAVCNMDWDRIRAEDILSVFNSFKPSDGIINSVKIYPSAYGLERMEEEKLHGPPELVEETLCGDSEKNDTSKEGSRYHREKLRQYQINRLKYYYAVIECDSPKTADFLYEQLNGMEYESSAVCLDIRFIPDDTTFDQEPKSIALTAPDPSKYKPRLFVNSALQQVKVNLTWDETEPRRREVLQKAFREPESIEKDIKDYLASSSSSDSEDCSDTGADIKGGRKLKMEERIAKYKSLLQSVEEKEKEKEDKYEMEITWEPGLREKTEEIVKEKIQKEVLNPFEEKLKKMKEGRKLKKNERKKNVFQDNEAFNNGNLECSDQEDSDSPNGLDRSNLKLRRKKTGEKNEMAEVVSNSLSDHDDKAVNSSVKGKQKRKKKKAETKADDFKVDIGDSRFSAIYTSHLYNIDPSDPHYKDTKGMQAIIQEKQKRKYEMSSNVSTCESSSKQAKFSQDGEELRVTGGKKQKFKRK